MVALLVVATLVVVGMVVEANLIIILLTATRGWRLCLHGRPGHLCQQSHD